MTTINESNVHGSYISAGYAPQRTSGTQDRDIQGALFQESGQVEQLSQEQISDVQRYYNKALADIESVRFQDFPQLNPQGVEQAGVQTQGRGVNTAMYGTAGKVNASVEQKTDSEPNVSILCAYGAGSFDSDKINSRLSGFDVENLDANDWQADGYDMKTPEGYQQAFKDALKKSEYIVLRSHGGRNPQLDFSYFQGKSWGGYGDYYDEMTVADFIKDIQEAKKDGTLKTKMIVVDACYSGDLSKQDIEALKKAGVTYIGSDDAETPTNYPLTIISEYQKNPGNLNKIISEINAKRTQYGNPPYKVYTPDK